MLKPLLQKILRNYHITFANKGLPERVGVYFHHLETGTHARFRDFVGYFRDRGYSFVSVDAYRDLQPKQVFISFDDNYRSWHRSLRLLDELDIRATFYANSLPFRDTAQPDVISNYFQRLEHAGEQTTLSRAELKEISDAGHKIACHTHSHFDLGSLSFEAAVEEILVNRALLEKITGVPIEHFSFPFGMRRNFSERLRTWCLSNGFSTVCNAIPGMQHSAFDPGNIYRTNWRFDLSLYENIDLLKVDGSLFERLTGKSPIG
jgi:peptidoglycan/xylan/chitin deacetylase (PgdA/CDA1 family)